MPKALQPIGPGYGEPAAIGRGNRWRGIALIVGCTVATLAAIAPSAPWKLIESRTFDYLSTIWLPAVDGDAPIVVAIDEPSFAEIGLQWPWPRSLHAGLVKTLRAAGARAIGLDIIFSEASKEPASDAALADALGPDVTLAGDETLIETPHADQTMRVEPLPAFLANGARTGIASVLLDNDGTLRRAPSYPDGFAAVLATMAGAQPSQVPAGALLQSFGPARSIPTVSYYQALKPDEFLPKDFFRGRAVIVGVSLQSAPAVEEGGSDAFATSFTFRSRHLVSGAEVQATIYENITKDLLIHNASPLILGLCVGIAALLAALSVWRGTGLRTAVLALAALLVTIGGSLALLQLARLYVPPVGPALAFVAVAAAQSALDYAAERRLRRSITRAFEQYLSPVLVARLAAEPARLRLGGERKTLTILFSDVRGFTSIAEGMKDEPEQLTRLMRRLLDPLSSVILAHGGTIDKYIGDAVMAFWNAPLDDPEHAIHAVEAALDMLGALDLLNAELELEARKSGTQAVRLGIGVGINTGDVIVGNMGSEHRFDYSALGDAVNLASRLEGQTRVYDVPLLLGEATASMVGGRFPVIELDRVRVKGKSELTRVFTIAAGADEATIATHAELLTEFHAGRMSPDDARLDLLASRLPDLASYYDRLREQSDG